MNELEQARLAIAGYFENSALVDNMPPPTGIELIMKSETVLEEPPPVKETEEPEDMPKTLRKRTPVVKAE